MLSTNKKNANNILNAEMDTLCRVHEERVFLDAGVIFELENGRGVELVASSQELLKIAKSVKYTRKRLI